VLHLNLIPSTNQMHGGRMRMQIIDFVQHEADSLAQC